MNEGALWFTAGQSEDGHMKNSRDSINARRNEILKIIESRRQISTQELNAMFDASPLTLRRDLDYWESEGCVQRYYGGVRFLVPEKEAPKFDEKLQSNTVEKQLIARHIAAMIEPDRTIFMNSGTTIYEVMRCLANKNETIITNNILAVDACSGGNCEIICTGGAYNDITRSYNGELATSVIQKTFADYCVLGVNGIGHKTGITTSIFQETIVNELMLERCNGMKIVAADSSKIGKIFRFTSVPLDRIDLLVTTSAADPDELAAIRDSGVTIAFADREPDTLI